MKQRFFLIFIVCILLAGGCRKYVSPYSMYYSDLTGGLDINNSPYFEKPDGYPVVIESFVANIKKDETRLVNEGYVLIGRSTFNAKTQHEHGVTKQARKVGAGKALWYSRYTESDFKTRTVPHMKFQYDRSGNIIGETATFHEETTETQHFDHGATYWAKLKDNVIRLGVSVKDHKVNHRRGMQVTGVRGNTPATQAGLLPGDTLTRIGKISIHDKESFLKALKKYAGDKISLVFWRDGEEYTRDVKLNRGMTIKEPFSSVIRVR